MKGVRLQITDGQHMRTEEFLRDSSGAAAIPVDESLFHVLPEACGPGPEKLAAPGRAVHDVRIDIQTCLSISHASSHPGNPSLRETWKHALKRFPAEPMQLQIGHIGGITTKLLIRAFAHLNDGYPAIPRQFGNEIQWNADPVRKTL